MDFVDIAGNPVVPEVRLDGRIDEWAPVSGQALRDLAVQARTSRLRHLAERLAFRRRNGDR